MNRLKDAYMRKMTKSVAGDSQRIVAEEKLFREQLKDVNFVKLANFYQVFIKEFKKEDLKKSYQTIDRAQLVKMMFLAELDTMMTFQDQADESISEIVELLKKGKSKPSLLKVTTKLGFLRKSKSKFGFQLPDTHTIMLKLGKLFGGQAIRDCYMSGEAFGQIKNKNKNRIIKPNYFKDQRVELQERERTLTLIKKEKQMKPKPKKRTFVWPGKKKKLNPMRYRLVFTDVRTERSRAVFYKTKDECQKVMNNAVLQRLFDQNPNQHSRFNIIKSIWKVKQSEYFYKNHVRPFLEDSEINQKMGAYQQKYIQLIRQY